MRRRVACALGRRGVRVEPAVGGGGGGPGGVLTINTPAGFERFVAEAGRPAGQLTLPDPQPPDVPLLLALAPKYGHEYVAGPAAGQADGQPGATTQTATAPSAPAGPAG